MKAPLSLLSSLLGAVLALAPVSSAWACATCACGDPTLMSMGTEQPFSGRLRFSSTLRGWGHTVGQDHVDALRLREARMDVAVAYAPLPWLFLSATLPLQAREVRSVSLARERGWGVGDVELTAKAFLYQDRAFSADHLFSVLVGVKLPTAPKLRLEDGTLMDLDTQLGSGSVDPLAGLAYQHFRGSWSFLVSATGFLPTRGILGYRAGASVRTTMAAQYQPAERWALRLGLDGRIEAAADIDGEKEENGGGVIGYASPDILFSPRMDLVVAAGVRVPFFNRLRGRVAPTPIAMLSVAYDL
ncbi:transporter [Myxococcus sp. MISCRS1]|uniref:transporter n=1 Tax=Myxococcus TaxID=32 RepID=UPI00226E4B9C|nr:transporter [Myxococcus sp. MISCRS1]MCY1000282.1 transporter [Myxococcus sp. MISCRS1]BDT38180.1 transporter [Myxococcus sp. MH1]